MISLLKLLKKYWRQITLLILVFLIIVILLIPQPAPPAAPPTLSSPRPSPAEFILPSYTQPPQTPTGEVDTTSSVVQKAIQSKKTLLPALPVYIENFSTSVGIATTINLYTLPQDPDYLIHFDIYGINYQNNRPEPTNPNFIAFKESFLYAKSLLQQKGINLQDIYFIFGGRQYIQETAALWIKALNLL